MTMNELTIGTHIGAVKTHGRLAKIHGRVAKIHGRVGKRTYKYQMIPRIRAMIRVSHTNAIGSRPDRNTRSSTHRQLNPIAHTGKHNNVIGKNNVETHRQATIIIVSKITPGHAIMRPTNMLLRNHIITPAIKPTMPVII